MGLEKKRSLSRRRFTHRSKAYECKHGESERLLGWEPTVSIEEGILKTIAWHRENKDLLDDLQV